LQRIVEMSLFHVVAIADIRADLLYMCCPLELDVDVPDMV